MSRFDVRTELTDTVLLRSISAGGGTRDGVAEIWASATLKVDRGHDQISVKQRFGHLWQVVIPHHSVHNCSNALKYRLFDKLGRFQRISRTKFRRWPSEL